MSSQSFNDKVRPRLQYAYRASRSRIAVPYICSIIAEPIVTIRHSMLDRVAM
jgi:hypothetical protein